MKKIWLSLLVCAAVANSLTFAATPMSWEVKNFSTKLENHKTSLLNKLSESQVKLQKIAQEQAKFSNLKLFEAALCLGIMTGESNQLDYKVLTDNLKNAFLNEYIKLDGDIKRFQLGISTTDGLIFGNNLESFYNQNALKITNLENDYYKKVTQVKSDFLTYVNNNAELLNTLSEKIEAMHQIDQAFSGAQKAFTGLSQEITKQTQLWNTMEKSRLATKKNLETALDQTINEVVAQKQPNGDIQAKFLIHKQNFLANFEVESQKALYALFAPSFDYGRYLKLKENYTQLHTMFDASTGSLNCPILLTSTLNFSPYLRNLDTNTSTLISGMNKITDGLKARKIRLMDLETSISGDFNKKLSVLLQDLQVKFKLMLASELLDQKPETQVVTGTIQTPQEQARPQVSTPKTHFTQAFKKGQYHEQVKALQSLLKNRGFYQGEITGIYDKTTIEAVYQFQLKHGIVTGKEKNKSGYGWFGAQTRAKVNALQW